MSPPITPLHASCPRLIAITPPGFLFELAWERQVEEALAAGLPAIMLREHARVSDMLLAMQAERLRRLTRKHGAQLIVNRRLELARQIEADGIHSGVGGPDAETCARLGEGALRGWSAHSPAEAMNAFAAGYDYITLSPIFVSPRKGPALGLGPLRSLTACAPGPVLALGGIDAGRAKDSLDAGAYGVAVIRAVFGQLSPAPAVRLLLGRLAAQGRS